MSDNLIIKRFNCQLLIILNTKNNQKLNITKENKEEEISILKGNIIFFLLTT